MAIHHTRQDEISHFEAMRQKAFQDGNKDRYVLACSELGITPELEVLEGMVSNLPFGSVELAQAEMIAKENELKVLKQSGIKAPKLWGIKKKDRGFRPGLSRAESCIVWIAPAPRSSPGSA